MAADNCVRCYNTDLQPTVHHHPLLDVGEEHHLTRLPQGSRGRAGPVVLYLTGAHHLRHSLEHIGYKISLQFIINQSTDITEQNSKGTFNVSQIKLFRHPVLQGSASPSPAMADFESSESPTQKGLGPNHILYVILKRRTAWKRAISQTNENSRELNPYFT